VAIVTRFLDRWDGPEAGDELPALLRAATSHEAARQRVIELIMSQVGPEIGARTPAGELEERLGLIVTQISGFAFSRYVLRHPLVVALDRETIIRRIGAVVQSYLTN
jgi:hypothetical protein